MRFDLLLTNKGRVRGVLWALVAGFAVCIGLVVLGAQPAFWWLMAVPLLMLGVLSLWDKLFCQPARVLLEDDSISWANPADSVFERYQFADLRAYRFDWSKIAIHLTLHLRTGEQVSISGRLHKEFWTMEEVFKQAIRRYNQAHPDAEVAWEPSGLTQFFTSPLSTRVLWGLLALGAAGVAWGISHDAPGPAYLPLLFIGLPYLLVWANFYYERP
jgi:hypothetical protein